MKDISTRIDNARKLSHITFLSAISSVLHDIITSSPSEPRNPTFEWPDIIPLMAKASHNSDRKHDEDKFAKYYGIEYESTVPTRVPIMEVASQDL